MALRFVIFRRVIWQSILIRGREYYRYGLVTDLEEDVEDSWVAAVVRTRAYPVRIQRQANQSLETSCPCPQDFGDLCKQIAATLHAMEDVFSDLFTGKRRKASSKWPSRLNRLGAALSAAPLAQLVKIMLNRAQGDREFQTYRLMDFFGGTTKKWMKRTPC